MQLQGALPGPIVVVALKSRALEERFFEETATLSLPQEGCCRGAFLAGELCWELMAEGHEGKALTMKTCQKLLFKHLPAICLLCSQRLFGGPFVWLRRTTERLAAHGQGWATAAGQP